MNPLSDSRRRLRKVLVFTAAYVLAATAGAIAAGNREFILYILVMVVLVPCLLAVHRRRPLTAALLWCFSIWGLLHMSGGLLPIPDGWFREGHHSVLYNWRIIPGFLKYDQFVHAYGFGITTWLCWHVLFGTVRSSDGSPLRPTPGIMVLCAAAGMGFGALNEVIEFMATRILPDTNVGDYENTGWDLVFNLLGAAMAAVIIRWRHAARSQDTLSRRPGTAA